MWLDGRENPAIHTWFDHTIPTYKAFCLSGVNGLVPDMSTRTAVLTSYIQCKLLTIVEVDYMMHPSTIDQHRKLHLSSFFHEAFDVHVVVIFNTASTISLVIANLSCFSVVTSVSNHVQRHTFSWPCGGAIMRI